MEKLDGGEPDTSDTIDVLKCLRCTQEGCTNVPSWGYAGHRPTLCSEHAAPNMVEVVPLCCRHTDCTSRRTFGYDGAAAQFCATHKLDGMVDLMKRRSQVNTRNARHTRGSLAGWPLGVCWSLVVVGVRVLVRASRRWRPRQETAPTVERPVDCFSFGKTWGVPCNRRSAQCPHRQRHSCPPLENSFPAVCLPQPSVPRAIPLRRHTIRLRPAVKDAMLCGRSRPVLRVEKSFSTG